MSLADPAHKMSKSLGDKHYVGLMEEPDAIWKKVRSAVTDSGEQVGGEMSPGVANLFEILRLTGAVDDVVDGFKAQHAAGKIRYGDLKTAVQDHIMRVLDPIRERRSRMSDDEIRDTLAAGAARASEIAKATMAGVRARVGVGPPPR